MNEQISKDNNNASQSSSSIQEPFCPAHSSSNDDFSSQKSNKSTVINNQNLIDNTSSFNSKSINKKSKTNKKSKQNKKLMQNQDIDENINQNEKQTQRSTKNEEIKKDNFQDNTSNNQIESLSQNQNNQGIQQFEFCIENIQIEDDKFSIQQKQSFEDQLDQILQIKTYKQKNEEIYESNSSQQIKFELLKEQEQIHNMQESRSQNLSDNQKESYGKIKIEEVLDIQDEFDMQQINESAQDITQSQVKNQFSVLSGIEIQKVELDKKDEHLNEMINSCPDRNIPIGNTLSSHSNHSSPSKSQSSLGVTLFKQDSKNFTMIVYDKKDKNIQSEKDKIEEQIENASQLNDQQSKQDQQQNQIEHLKDQEQEFEFDQEEIEQNKIKKFQSQILPECQNADDSISLSSQNQAIKKKRKKKAKLSQQEAMNQFILKQQCHNEDQKKTSQIQKQKINTQIEIAHSDETFESKTNSRKKDNIPDSANNIKRKKNLSIVSQDLTSNQSLRKQKEFPEGNKILDQAQDKIINADKNKDVKSDSKVQIHEVIENQTQPKRQNFKQEQKNKQKQQQNDKNSLNQKQKEAAKSNDNESINNQYQKQKQTNENNIYIQQFSNVNKKIQQKSNEKDEELQYENNQDQSKLAKNVEKYNKQKKTGEKQQKEGVQNEKIQNSHQNKFQVQKSVSDNQIQKQIQQQKSQYLNQTQQSKQNQNPEQVQKVEEVQYEGNRQSNETQHNNPQLKRITHSFKQHSQNYSQNTFSEFGQQLAPRNQHIQKSSLNLESKEFKAFSSKQNNQKDSKQISQQTDKLQKTSSFPLNKNTLENDLHQEHSQLSQLNKNFKNTKISISTENESELESSQISQQRKNKQKNTHQNQVSNNQYQQNKCMNQVNLEYERYKNIDLQNQLRNNYVNKNSDLNSQSNIKTYSESSVCLENSFNNDNSDHSFSSNSFIKNNQSLCQNNYKQVSFDNQNFYGNSNPILQNMSSYMQNQGFLPQANQFTQIPITYMQPQQVQQSQPQSFQQENDIDYQEEQDQIEDKYIQNQNHLKAQEYQSSKQRYKQSAGPGSNTSIAHINQMNQYNINSFPNINLNQIQNPPIYGHSYNQPSAQYYYQLQGIPNQYPQMNHNYQSNFIGNIQSFDQSNMISQIQNISQLQNMAIGIKHPHHMFDQNLPQNIEYKFYEKFDNDIYDEVNNIQNQLNITKDERNFVLQKLQNLCEQVFLQKNEDIKIEENQSVDNIILNKKSKSHPSPLKSINNKKLTPKIKQFGSLVTGLALESSDMDMAVTNLYLPDREKMIECLDLFAENIKKWEMIQDLNAISTASIPVIKANVDLNQLREKEMNLIGSFKDKEECSKDFGQTQTDICAAEMNQQKQIIHKTEIPGRLAKLKIDITFDDNLNQEEEEENKYEFGINTGFTPPHYFLTKQSFINGGLVEHKTHLGIASCKLIKHYVETYKCLKEVSIVLKLFLSTFKLNSPYHGGLSSYSTVLLLVAYMNKWNLKMSPSLTPSRLLMGFLDYYSYYFNVSLFGIDVSNNGSFYEHGSPESYFVILDPLNENNNTTKNSFLTHEIIKSFRKAFNSLKNLLIQYQQQQKTKITTNLLDIILERNQQTENQQEQKSTQCEDEHLQNQQTQQTQTENQLINQCTQSEAPSLDVQL